MRALYDYRVGFQRPASQMALRRLIDRELTHAETIAAALRWYASSHAHDSERGRAEAAIRDIQAAAGDETELHKIARKLRAALTSRKRAIADLHTGDLHEA